MVTPFSSAALMIFLVRASGIPSAMMAMVRIWNANGDAELRLHLEEPPRVAVLLTCGCCMVSMVLSKAERKDAKLMSTSTSGCFFMASLMFL